ncbi:hemin uptake protein HemP [Chitinasiproducens palmae]|uniref:Hemin uptake protein hemP n=1 Tax=Chitinasiproducens palmae TaxID=1770053 RepID=A0A1H2PTD3_9BURK|nr:hemin uptake protein HemP [Chitinasiproducens palmae]SDV49950.1 Hemin uptake protein hemP [Chitinasiproducens palmae]
MLSAERSTQTLSLRKPAGNVRVVAANGRPVLSASRVASKTVYTPAQDDGVVASQTLLGGRKVMQIAHNGETYQLRLTRHGKLILTK